VAAEVVGEWGRGKANPEGLGDGSPPRGQGAKPRRAYGDEVPQKLAIFFE